MLEWSLIFVLEAGALHTVLTLTIQLHTAAKIADGQARLAPSPFLH